MSGADAAHLLRRAGFGGSTGEIGALTGVERASAVDHVLNVGVNPPASNTPGGLAHPETENESEYQLWLDLVQYWLDRMATVPSPLQEKMVLFWHGHFVSEHRKLNDSRRLWQQNQLFRAHALGDFEALTQAVAVDPAMLLYLDNAFNEAGDPQENFARELMELFTLGVDQYSQADVVDVARAWTGHGLAHKWEDWGRYYQFHGDRHDYGQKTIFGIPGAWDGPGVIHEICAGARSAVMARFIATKVWSFFAYPNPPSWVIDAIAPAFAATRSISGLVRAVFLHDEFWSATARNGLVRSPAEYVVTTMRSTGRSAADLDPQWWMEAMGQMLFNPPNVSGWRPNGYWISTAAVSARSTWARHVAWAVVDTSFPINYANFKANSGYTNAQLVDLGFRTFGITEPAASTRALLQSWLDGGARSKWYAAPNIVVALMSTPDFNLA